MTWATLIPIILQYGIPYAEKVLDLWLNHKNDAPTQAEWDTLKALAQNTALSQMKAALARAGIPETDPHAVALLAQVPQ